jgi:small subunit ribosomal protein S20
MPQIKSAFKRLRQDKKKHIRNKSRISEVRTLKKKVHTLIAANDKKEAEQALKTLESRLGKAVKTNTVRANTASRYISRLRRQVGLIGKK